MFSVNATLPLKKVRLDGCSSQFDASVPPVPHPDELSASPSSMHLGQWQLIQCYICRIH